VDPETEKIAEEVISNGDPAENVICGGAETGRVGRA